MKILGKWHLNKLALKGCQVPGCNHDHDRTIFLHAQCHIGGRLEISYTAGEEVLRIDCAECKTPVAVVRVGWESSR